MMLSKALLATTSSPTSSPPEFKNVNEVVLSTHDMCSQIFDRFAIGGRISLSEFNRIGADVGEGASQLTNTMWSGICAKCGVDPEAGFSMDQFEEFFKEN